MLLQLGTQPLKGWDYAPLKEAFESLLAKHPPDPLLPKLRQHLAKLAEVPTVSLFFLKIVSVMVGEDIQNERGSQFAPPDRTETSFHSQTGVNPQQSNKLLEHSRTLGGATPLRGNQGRRRPGPTDALTQPSGMRKGTTPQSTRTHHGL